MKVITNSIRLQYNDNRQPEVILTTSGNILKEVEELKTVLSKGKQLSVEIKQHREKRSLDANSYFWVILQKMAEVLKTTKDELYLEVLERYGVFTHIVVKPNVVDKVKSEWRTCRELGEVIINGKVGVQIQCYFGSSTYNQKEMSVLIDGLVSECKELGIETMTPRDLELLKSEWGKKE